jgi:hypothetical protein
MALGSRRWLAVATASLALRDAQQGLIWPAVDTRCVGGLTVTAATDTDRKPRR